MDLNYINFSIYAKLYIVLNRLDEHHHVHGVRIVGTYVPTANPLKIPDSMNEWVRDMNQKNKDGIAHIANLHTRFEKIHPFADGNGRVGRMLMHAMALRLNWAPVVVLEKKRGLYFSCLNKAQTQNDQSLLEDFVCEAIVEGYGILERRLSA